jgi:hypothetical protein
MSKEHSQPKYEKLDRVKKSSKKLLWPAVIGAGVLFPSAVFTHTAATEGMQRRSEEISHFLDNRPAEIVEGVAMAAGVALTINGYLAGEKWDEKKLHALRVAGPALLTAAATTAFVDSQTSINYAIPTSLAFAGLYTTAVINTVSIFERTKDLPLRTSALVAGSTIALLGATIVLAATEKL